MQGDDYKEIVLQAVNLGEDTDTIASIVGQLAALYYGYDNIPDEWLHQIRNKALIESVCGNYYDMLDL